MRQIIKIGVLTFLMSGLLSSERAVAQLKYSASTPANNAGNNGNGGRGGYGGHGGGYGGYGGYGGGYGGYGGFGLLNPYNPISPFSPFNPMSPYSPYNPISPISPYYNPAYAPYYASAYIYNPIYNPGLLSRNPRIQLEAWGIANITATNTYAYSNYYDSMLQNQQAYANNYNAALYNQQAQNSYIQAQNVTNMALYNALATQQYQNNVINPYGPPQRQGPAPAPAPSPSSSRGFSGGAATNYDPYASPGVSPGQSWTSFDNSKTSGQFRPAPPTYGQKELAIHQENLQRIQAISSPGEIISGSAQNVLVKDISKFIAVVGSNSAMPPVTLADETLREVNVVKNGGNLAVIRNDGKIEWPKALGGYILSNAEKAKIQTLTSDLVLSASKGKVDNSLLISMGLQIEEIRGKLMKKINELPTDDYLNSKRFLYDFADTLTALEKNEWPNHVEYRKFIDEAPGKGRTVQDLAAFMVKKGYKFAPATGQDEGSYRALYAALVAYDLALNAQFTVAAKE